MRLKGDEMRKRTTYLDHLRFRYGAGVPDLAAVLGPPSSVRRSARPPLLCADCGKRMHRVRGSLPQGSARCHPCRRAEPSPSTIRDRRGPVRPLVTHCRRCDGLLPAPSRSRRYCSPDCARRARNDRGWGGRPTVRGYGTEHRRLRAATIGGAVGSPCVLCGEVMDDPARMHLDHTEDRSGYRGFAHDSCNVRDGARRGGAAFRARKLATRA